MVNRTKRTVKKDDKFFAVLAQGLPVQAALDASGYKRRTVYQWRDEDDDFRNQWAEAVERAIETMEAEADRRALEGVVKPVFYRGMECGQLREYSDTLLIFRLKALSPRYRETSKHEVSGPSGGPLSFTLTFDRGDEQS